MANIKISELNELLPGQKAYDDYLAIVDSSADETKKISVETLTSTGVKLIAVSSTEPTEFSNGDKYYNTTTNRIYEARTDVWYNPQEPVEGIFYIIFDSQNIYTYDKENETLVSVGGGAGGGEVLPVGTEVDFDGNVSDIPIGWEQIDSYSTNEVKTGQNWIDGKPIYRKVYTSYTTSSDSNYDYIILGTNNINIINSYGTLLLDNSNTVAIGTGDVGYGVISNVIKNLSNQIYIARTKNAYGTLSSIAVVIEYTKTTD